MTASIVPALILLTCTPAWAGPGAASVAAPSRASAVVAEHGKIPWFEGSFEEALRVAQEKRQLVFLDFWTDW